MKSKNIQIILAFIVFMFSLSGLFLLLDHRQPTTTISTPTPIPTLTSIPTPIPTILPTKAPTKIPTKAPTKIPTPTPTQAPTTGVVNNQTKCAIVARAINEGVPQTYNFAYSAYNLGTRYVVGSQWDYNGDNNWDSDITVNDGNVNYTYSTPGIRTVNLRTKLNDGTLLTCSTQVAVQPH